MTDPAAQSAERAISTSTAAVMSVPIDSVPGKPACSPLAETPIGGATTMPGLRAASRSRQLGGDERVGAEG